MKIKTASVPFLVLILTISTCTQKPENFKGIIIADKSGDVVQARVHVTTLDGVRVELDGIHEHAEYLSATWCYSDGNFSIANPPTDLIVEIRKGLENRAIKDTNSPNVLPLH